MKSFKITFFAIIGIVMALVAGTAFATERPLAIDAINDLSVVDAGFYTHKASISLLGYEIKNKYGGTYTYKPGSLTGDSYQTGIGKAVAKYLVTESDKSHFQAMSEKAHISYINTTNHVYIDTPNMKRVILSSHLSQDC